MRTLLRFSTGAIMLLIAALCLTIPAHGQDTGTPTPTLTDPQILDQARQIVDDANTAVQSATGIVTNADSAVTTSNRTLIIAAGSMVIGGLFVVLIAALAFVSALNTIRETNAELAKARSETALMRHDLQTNTEQVREQAARSLQALGVMQLGEQQLSRNNITGATQIYEHALALDPQNRAINYFLGELYIQAHRVEQGIEHLERVLASTPDYAPAEAALGLAFRVQGDHSTEPGKRALLYVQAEAHLLRALRMDPTARDLYNSPIQAVLGSLYKRQGRIDQAVTRYEDAYKSAPQQSYLAVNLAVLCFVQGNLAKARSLADQVAASTITISARDRFDDWARLNHLIASLILGKPDDALRDVDAITADAHSAKPPLWAIKATLDDLNRLSNAQQPPPGIAEVITRLSRLQN